MRAVALLVAAGRGERLGGEGPKALVPVAGRPLLAHAMDALDACDRVEGVVVAAPGGRADEVRRVAGASRKLIAVVEGGDSRQASVRRALEAAPEGFEAVVCHDVARALARPALFEAVLDALETADGAVPVLPVSDTVKRLDGAAIGGTVSREGLWLAQTPQAFRRHALEAAHRAAAAEGFRGTDDASLLERAAYKVVAVPGDPGNLKVTTPADLRLAEALIAGG